MTRKDFELIAEVLADASPRFPSANDEYLKGYREAIEDVADDFAYALAGTNPAFDQARFLNAAGAA